MNYPEHMYQTKPARVKGLVWRNRLEPLGRRMLEYQVTAVVAPAGFGKTVWVSSLLESPDWPPAVWIGLDRRDSDPSFFLQHLIRSVNGANQSSDAWRTLMSLENVENEWAIAAAAFIGDLPRDGLWMLVMDDVDFLRGNRVAVASIEFMLSRLPANIRIVFIARSDLPFELFRQEIGGQLLRIGGGELLFLEDEARALYAGMKLALSDDDISALYYRTEGWAVGLRLLGIYLGQPGNSLKEALRGLHREDSAFYRYIINEVLESMPEDQREFLLDASFLPYLEIGLCDAAFARADSGSMLGYLRGYGLLSHFDGGEGCWRMHHLVEDWLRDIAGKKRTPLYVIGIRERAAAFFERSGDTGRAVEQCFLAEQWDAAAEMIHRHGFEFCNSGFRMDILYKWIDRLPKQLVENDCWLLYFKGTSLLHVDDRLAYQTLSLAADLAGQNRASLCEAGAILNMMLTAIFCGDLTMSDSAGRRLLGHPELLANPDSHGMALAAAAQYAMARDDIRKGLELSLQALRLDLPPEVCMWMRYTAVYMLMRVGRLPESRQMIMEALAMPYVIENERRLIAGHEVLIDIAFISCDFVTLEAAGRKCVELGRKYGMNGIAGRVYYLKAQRLLREGQLSESLRLLDLAYENFTSAGVVHFANQTAIDILLLRIRNGENAATLLPQVMELKTRFDSIPYGMGIDYMVNTLAGIAAMEAGDTDMAEHLIQKSALRWREVGARISLAWTNLLLARLSLMRGDETACDSLLREALGEAEAWQWENCWEWDPAAVFSMCRRAIENDIHPQWAARILRRWFPEQSRREFSLFLVSPRRQLQALAADYFRHEYSSTGITVLSVFFFGGFRLFINGLEVPELNWKTKKAKALFQCLIAGNRAFGKEYLMQQLWPDGDAGSGDGKLRMTLSYARKALAAVGLTSECIVMRRGEICLNPSFELHCDYDAFMRSAHAALRFAKANHPSAILALGQAVRAYGGEFLPEDPYLDFAAGLRAELRNLYLEVLLQLALLQFARSDMTAALQTCAQYLTCEPVDETIVRLAMNIYCALKKKHKALEMFQTLSKTLAREYNATPERETTALYHKIQSG